MDGSASRYTREPVRKIPRVLARPTLQTRSPRFEWTGSCQNPLKRTLRLGPAIVSRRSGAVIPPVVAADFTRMVNDRFPAQVARVVSLRRQIGRIASQHALIQMLRSEIIQIV